MTEQEVVELRLCVECKKKPTWPAQGYKSKFKRRDCCFNCALWLDILDRFNAGDSGLLVGGFANTVVHRVGRPAVSGATTGLGYGGRWWRIVMNDGEVIITNNLWCNGEVPAHLADMFEQAINVKTMSKPSLDEIKKAKKEAGI